LDGFLRHLEMSYMSPTTFSLPIRRHSLKLQSSTLHKPTRLGQAPLIPMTETNSMASQPKHGLLPSDSEMNLESNTRSRTLSLYKQLQLNPVDYH
jgi:hypothetical protein